MSTPMENLRAIADALGNIEGVRTSKIGLEPNITPEDYPIVRIVPPRLNGFEVIGLRKVTLNVYYGTALQAFDGLDTVYEALFALEERIIDAIEGGPWRGFFRETITDEDRLTTYKMFMSRFEVML